MKEPSSLQAEYTLLRQLFGDNRAEWPSEHFRELFVEPTYLKKLESNRPCILVGGRGTGKTTSLQSLKFKSTLERLESSGRGFGDLEYFGVLVRMNKNRVRAFQGDSASEELWSKAFAHYFNLLVCLELTELALWLEKRSNYRVNPDLVNDVAIDLGLKETNNFENLKKAIKRGVSELQLFVNNPSDKFSVQFSIAESPLRKFAEVLYESNLLGERVIFCCIDEYENLLKSQQAILNTYIKHSEPPLSYKVGVRKNGLRNRQTLDGQDLLKTPDDYAEIEIADEGFDYFARAVADLRLKCALANRENVPNNLDSFLQDLSFSEEAILLGADKVALKVLEELKESDSDLYKEFSLKEKSEVYFLKYWQASDARKTAELANDWIANETVWQTRIGNHGYSSLFWLSRGNKGKRIRKYYCGPRVLLSLAAGNIRFFLELIDTAIGYQLQDEQSTRGEPFVISPKAQTLAARDVGKNRLNQLEGLADNGVQLKRLVLAIGKVFFELARTPVGKTPEVTSFVINGEPSENLKIHKLLSEGVGHLAFEVSPRTKATSYEVRDDEYRLHRIFCAFFEISHRKKRRLTFNAKDLLNILKDKPGKAISSLLDGISQSEEEDLPEQLAFFSSFYDDK